MTNDTAKKLTKRGLPPQVRLSVKAGQAKKGEDVLVLDLRELTSFTDFFVILTGNSSRQNAAIVESIEQDLKKKKTRPLGIEGKEVGEWILMDYGDFVVHVFSKRAREYYSLEKLWADAPRVAYADTP
jgi:ribosome-associated protein